MCVSLLESFDGEDVFGVFIPNRQRFTLFIIGSVPPSFEVDRPDIIRGFGLQMCLDSAAFGLLPFLSMMNQSCFIKDAFDGGEAWGIIMRMGLLVSAPVINFLKTPE